MRSSDISTGGTLDPCLYLEEQKKVWPLLRENYENLRNAEVRDFEIDGMRLILQHNPGRIRSTCADLSPGALHERKCFLCTENLPAEQFKLELPGGYLLLCNPYPIFGEHFTIPYTGHLPQSITDSFGSMLEISKLLGGKYTLFYNGPRCGASAPDHLHFQVSPRGAMPLERDLPYLSERYSVFSRKAGSSGIKIISDPVRSYLLLESGEETVLESLLRKILQVLPISEFPGEEPMVNILCLYTGAGWQVIIFPRERHRPASYYLEGESRILFSPASVDLSGLLIFPRERDFQKITGETAAGLIREVSLSPESVERLKGAVRAFSLQ